jgi:predicted O-methyltransferase YrrM
MHIFNILIKYLKFNILLKYRFKNNNKLNEKIIKKRFCDKDIFYKIEKSRYTLLKSKININLKGYGNGSFYYRNDDNIMLSKVVKHSSITPKYGRFLYNIVRNYNPSTIIELGTSTGISTQYLAFACIYGSVISVEGEKILANIANETIKKNGLKNVEIINKTFKEALPELMSSSNYPLLIFIDGDHNYEATKNYFRIIENMAKDKILIIIDDIYYNKGIEKAWEEIILSDSVIMYRIFFKMGIILINHKNLS